MDNLRMPLETLEALAHARKPPSADEWPRLEVVEVAETPEQSDGRVRVSTPLQSGVAVVGWVDQYEYAYYKISVPNANMALIVQVCAHPSDKKRLEKSSRWRT